MHFGRFKTLPSSIKGVLAHRRLVRPHPVRHHVPLHARQNHVLRNAVARLQVRQGPQGRKAQGGRREPQAQPVPPVRKG